MFTVTNEKNLDNYFSQPKVKEELKELFKECNKLHDRRRFPHEEVMNKEFNAVA